MKVWITKYALTQGIYEAEASIVDSVRDGSMIVVQHGNSSYTYFHGKGKGWTETKAEAVVVAINMRKKKIGSLHKQINKLKLINFLAM